MDPTPAPRRPSHPPPAAFLLAIAVAATACDRAHQPTGPYDPSPNADLQLIPSIGGRSGDADYEFARISGVVVQDDGTVWVADGGAQTGTSGAPPKLRRYDAGGTFLGQVGRDGQGPGEYSAPNGLARLRDGRVVLRDVNLQDRLTLFGWDGTLDTVLVLPTRLFWIHFGAEPLMADTASVLWLRFRGRPGPDRPEGFVRVNTGGSILDTVPFPRIPEVPRVSVPFSGKTVSGGTFRSALTPRHQPTTLWAPSPDGRLATVARTDAYRIEVAPSTGDSRPDSSVVPRVLERNVAPVPVSAQEQEAEREEMRTFVERYSGGPVALPELPAVNPVLRGLQFAEDGQLLVGLAAPGVEVDGRWTDPPHYDVFSRDGAYRGRLELPVGFYLRGMRGNRLWGIQLGDFGVETVVVYEARWR